MLTEAAHAFAKLLAGSYGSPLRHVLSKALTAVARTFARAGK
jgi:hypothetical protein